MECSIFKTLLHYARQLYIIILCLPRDIYGLYKYSQLTLFSLYCKHKNHTVSSYFDQTASKNMTKVCFFYEDEVWTFKKVQDYSLRVANYFKKSGYKKGDVVGLFMENRPEYVALWLGLGRIGVVTSLLNYNLRLGSLEHCVKVSNCKALIFGTELSAALEETMKQNQLSLKLYSIQDYSSQTPEQSPTLSQDHINLSNELKETPKLEKEDYVQVNNSDVALLLFTSGTTGLPKSVIMTYSRLFSYASVFYPAGMDPAKDILLTPIPLYHVQGGLLGVSCSIIHGVPQVILRKFSASNFWKQCIKYDATYCQYLGEIIRYLQNQPETPEEKLHKVHTFYGNGVNPAVWKKFVERFNVKIKEMYGSTEGNCSIMNVGGYVGATGYLPWLVYPLLPVFIARTDGAGNLVRDPRSGLLQHTDTEEPGELLGKIVENNPLREFNGYTDKGATEAKIIKNVKRKGDAWFRTGDIFTIDAYGFMYFKDRSGDTFRWKGENVSTAEVEDVLSKGSGYKSVVVYGIEIPGYEGKCGMATVSDPDGDLDLSALSEGLRAYLPSYARPLFLRVSNREMQMTGTFKLQKFVLQRQGIKEVGTDKVYFLHSNGYVPLDNGLYGKILDGSLRL